MSLIVMKEFPIYLPLQAPLAQLLSHYRTHCYGQMEGQIRYILHLLHDNIRYHIQAELELDPNNWKLMKDGCKVVLMSNYCYFPLGCP